MDFRQTLTARQLLWHSKPVRFPGWAWRQLKYLGLIATGQRPTIATVPMRLGHKMTIDMNIGFQRRVFFSGQYDDLELAFVKKFLRTNVVILV